jgi:hypothetical protein
LQQGGEWTSEYKREKSTTLKLHKKWDNKKCLTFQDNVDKENLNGIYNELTNSISENITKDNINASVKQLCDIFVDSAQTTFGTYKNKRKNLN